MVTSSHAKNNNNINYDDDNKSNSNDNLLGLAQEPYCSTVGLSSWL